MKLWKVRPSAAEAAKLKEGDTIVDGFLAFCGVIQLYHTGDANKKCDSFDGKKERHQSAILEGISEVTMTQIGEDALVWSLEQALKGREAFKDADPTNNERIFLTTTLTDMLTEYKQVELTLDTKGVDQLKELIALVRTDYLQIICK